MFRLKRLEPEGNRNLQDSDSMAKKVENKETEKKSKKEKSFNFKLFNKWDSNVEVKDPSLAPYITLTPVILPRTAGYHQKHRFHKSKMHIVERLALHLFGPGHQGKRHRKTSGRCAGNFIGAMKIIEGAFDIIEKETKKNPIEVLVRAIENASIREEVTSYQVGSIMVRSAVVTAPQRRIDKCLRFFAQGAYLASFNKKKSAEEALANEILMSYKGEGSYAMREKERIEREASGAR